MSTLATKETPEILLSHELLTPLSIFEEMDRLSREIQERAFSFFEERGGLAGWELGDWLRAEAEFLRPLPIEVEELEKEIVVRAEVPGFEVKELSVSADSYRLRIYGKGEKREKEPKPAEGRKTRHYSEIAKKEALREVDLPVAVNPDLAVARLEKGVLEIRLPKMAPAKLIEVKAA